MGSFLAPIRLATDADSSSLAKLKTVKSFLLWISLKLTPCCQEFFKPLPIVAEGETKINLDFR